MIPISTHKICLVVSFLLVAFEHGTATVAFVSSPSSLPSVHRRSISDITIQRPYAVTSSSCATTTTSTTALSERKWNFNEGQSPWGMKINAETWNGRIAQIAFVWVFLQELVTGKGIISGIAERDPFFIANAALFGFIVLGLTGWLAIQGDDDYTKEA